MAAVTELATDVGTRAACVRCLRRALPTTGIDVQSVSPQRPLGELDQLVP